jgi:thiamine pyrophosphokinase
MCQEKGICYIVGAMPLDEGFSFQPQQQDLVIAADGGYASLCTLGIRPDFVIGDFDSLDEIPDHPDLLRLPRIKDETDMGYAINHALTLGYTRFLLLGGMGGRLEHTIANLQLLAGLNQRGALGILYGSGQAAAVITNGRFTFPADLSGYCSVFCQSGVAEGVSIEGMKYPLFEDELTGDFPLGVSNEFLGIPAVVSVEQGTLLLIWACDGQENQLQNVLLSNNIT